MWNPITVQDVLDEFSLQEQTSLQGLNATGSLEKILAKTVGMVRGSIKAGGTPLGGDGTIPDQLMQDAIAIARWRWLSSVPLLAKFKSEERRQLYNDARETLREVSKGDMKVELPDAQFVSNATASPGDQVQVITSSHRSTVETSVTGRRRQPLHGLI